VHNSTRHTASECREIKKLAEQFREKMQQQRHDGSSSRQREGKQKMDSQEEKDAEMEFQDAKRALKAVYVHSNSESSDNERRKTLHVMFGGSWAVTSRRVVKTLRREVAAAAPASKVAPHRKWVETPIGFDSSDCPKSMVGVGQLPLLVSQTISNVKLYHVLIDGGATLNLISLAAFKKLQIPMGKLQPSRPFSSAQSPSRSHSGRQRTSSRRASSSMLRRSASRSTPFWADQLYTSSGRWLITGTWF
jgi:hypothetical protein